eukprot:6152094-Amphidinium_carterae.1
MKPRDAFSLESTRSVLELTPTPLLWEWGAKGRMLGLVYPRNWRYRGAQCHRESSLAPMFICVQNTLLHLCGDCIGSKKKLGTHAKLMPKLELMSCKRLLLAGHTKRAVFSIALVNNKQLIISSLSDA